MAKHLLNAAKQKEVSSDCSSTVPMTPKEYHHEDIVKKSTKKKIEQAKHENIETRWRWVVVSMLVVNAMLVLVATYVFLSSQQYAEFEAAFREAACSINDSSQFLSSNIVETLQYTADHVAAYGASTKQRFPFVTLPQFETTGSHARQMTFTEFVGFAPIVREDQRTYWESYSFDNQGWLEESRLIAHDENSEERHKHKDNDNTTATRSRGLNGPFFRPEERQAAEEEDGNHDSSATTPIDFAGEEHGYDGHGLYSDDTNTNESSTIIPRLIHGIVFGEDGISWHPEEEGSGPYLPIWQTSPPPNFADIINFNLNSCPIFSTAIRSLEKCDKHTIITKIMSLRLYFDSIYEEGEHTRIHQANHVDSSSSSSSSSSSGVTMPEKRGFGSDHPHSVLFEPVFDKFRSGELAGVVFGFIAWDKYFSNVLPDGIDGIICVVENSCNQTVTFEVNGKVAAYVGKGDFHDEKYSLLGLKNKFVPVTHEQYAEASCDYTFSIYPSDEFRARYRSQRPAVFTAVLALLFLVTVVAFFGYVRFIQYRQNKVLAMAEKTSNIVESLFPSTVRERIMADVQERAKSSRTTTAASVAAGTTSSNNNNSSNSNSYNISSIGKNGIDSTKVRIKNFLSGESKCKPPTEVTRIRSKPIADLFPEATVMFSDIVGFTAWSSVREPTHVFELLETLYSAFDKIASRRGVFKVETVGDCYVAVAGLPEPCDDHPVVMARFAGECLHAMNYLVKKLEVPLGPDTGDLSMRFGLHSGPITAGVLRGDRSRFQLFGDTVNTGSRMESTCKRGRIQVSRETAGLLLRFGKGGWLKRREEKVFAKGKGEMQTFWLMDESMDLDTSYDGSTTGGLEDDSFMPEGLLLVQSEYDGLEKLSGNDRVSVSDKYQCFVDWNVHKLHRLLKQVVARRALLKKRKSSSISHVVDVVGVGVVSSSRGGDASTSSTTATTGGVFDEVKEVITLPKFDANTAARELKKQHGVEDIELDRGVTSQLHDYVSRICNKYRDNPFHNFEHASHVTMSVIKLLNRIVTPGDFNYKTTRRTKSMNLKLVSDLHDFSYGITSDPLTQFAVVLSALIHDVDHDGVPNAQLVKEKADVAVRYKNQSVAEQNSIDVAWNLLMQPKYEELRNHIYSGQEEAARFRQLVVNSVMATDIVDTELKELRNCRWDKAFKGGKREEAAAVVVEAPPPPAESSTFAKDGDDSNEDNDDNDDEEEDVNRKATIVIEHLIQASDVAHTMQHWHVYRKWNERLFEEMYLAYINGRSETDPSEVWYEGELGFFDYYIIPLAKKLKECGCFGVFSDEYLTYALENRAEWERKGERVVEDMVHKCNKAAF